MTKVKAVTATILAAAGSFALSQSSGSAQPNLPEAPGVQQNAEQNVQEQARDVEARTTGKADVETKAADVDAKAKAKAKARTTDRAEARVQKRANAQGKKARNKARAKADADLKEDVEANSESNGEAQADANRKERAKSRLNADGTLGFEFADDNSDEMTISAVSDNSLATRAGLRQGDRIVSIDGRTFNSTDAMVRFLNRNQNRQFPITFLRNDQRYSVTVTPQMFAQNRGQDDLREARPRGLFGTTYAQGTQGVYIDEIHDGSPAHQAGLQSGDRIVCFNGWSYQNAEQFETYLERFPRDRALPMTYIRDGRMHSGQVTLISDRNTEATARLEENSRSVPPVPQPTYDEAVERTEEFVESDSPGQRRTALRPNFDEMSNAQLRQEVQQLRRENKNLRQQLMDLRQNRAAEAAEDSIDESEVTDEVEEASDKVEGIEEAQDVQEEADPSTTEKATEVETEVELKTDATEEVETP